MATISSPNPAVYANNERAQLPFSQDVLKEELETNYSFIKRPLINSPIGGELLQTAFNDLHGLESLIREVLGYKPFEDYSDNGLGALLEQEPHYYVGNCLVSFGSVTIGETIPVSMTGVACMEWLVKSYGGRDFTIRMSIAPGSSITVVAFCEYISKGDQDDLPMWPGAVAAAHGSIITAIAVRTWDFYGPLFPPSIRPIFDMVYSEDNDVWFARAVTEGVANFRALSTVH